MGVNHHSNLKGKLTSLTHHPIKPIKKDSYIGLSCENNPWLVTYMIYDMGHDMIYLSIFLFSKSERDDITLRLLWGYEICPEIGILISQPVQNSTRMRCDWSFRDSFKTSL